MNLHFPFENTFADSQISSNFSLSDPRELLIAATTIYHDSGKDDIKINALISFLNIIYTDSIDFQSLCTNLYDLQQNYLTTFVD